MTEKGFKANDNDKYVTNYNREEIRKKRKKNNGKQVKLKCQNM